ncbi:MAG: thiamine-phosphate kinase [Sterolibacteriaceae bacterium MAG5]|nr:thiamine-phosphate kinase [Candidatus Nitricoxidireducens bremensis]
MPSEFALIDRYFRRPARNAVLGVGDDGAIVRPRPGMDIVVSTDMLVAGTHFLPNADPAGLGWKTLAVNVSDMAAMGAEPRWALLAAALPAATESWIAAFAEGFFACAGEFGVDVIGGDTTKGPRNFCVTIFGEVPEGKALLRSGARRGDEVWVSGAPGLAALGLAHLQGRTVLCEPALTSCLAALHRPQPRVALGLALRGLANSAIDISDGLLADIGHILEESGVAASLHQDRMPPDALQACNDTALAQDCLLAGGDDYELAFTVPAERHAEVEALANTLPLALTCIGTVTAGDAGQIAVLDANGAPLSLERRGYDHFGSGMA